MIRLHFLTPSADSTISIVHELNDIGIAKNKVHVVAKDSRLLEKMDINKATLIQTSDVVHAAKRGAPLGAFLGGLAGIYAAYQFPFSTFATTLMIMAMVLFGAIFGTWTSTLIGVSVPDGNIEKYEKDIESGYMLILVDIPKEQEQEVKSVIKQHHPEAEIERTGQELQQQVKGFGV